MRKKISSISIVFVLVIAMIAALDFSFDIIPNASAATIYVGGSGPGNYSSIQEGIDASNNGDTVYVLNNRYHEIIVIDKPIQLIGEDWDDTIIDADDRGDAVTILADGVTISGFKIFDADSHYTSLDAGIMVRSDNNDINNNRILHNRVGILLNQSQGNDITHNDFYNNWGINVYSLSSHNNNINYNAFYGWRDGVLLENSQDNNINHNSFERCLPGISVEDSDRNIMTNNLFANNTWGVDLDSSYNNDIIDNDFFSNSIAIKSWYGGHNDVLNNNFLNDHNSIYFVSTGGNNIKWNTVHSNDGDGIHASGSGNKIENNEVVSNREDGIYVSGNSNDIKNNHIVSNKGYGIFVWSGTGTEITNNNISWNGRGGIYCNMPKSNYINDNYLSSNFGPGITISPHSREHNISNNHLINNAIAVYLENSRKNELNENNMINNGIYIRGDQLDNWNSHKIETSNQVNEKPVYFWKNETSGTVPQNAGQIILANCTNVTISDQYISNSSVGIELGFSSNNFIRDCKILKNSLYGIFLENSHHNEIKSNNLSFNSNGTSIYNSNNNKIMSNNASNNNFGFYVNLSSLNELKNNFAINNSYSGIYLEYSDGNKIEHNSLSENGMKGTFIPPQEPEFPFGEDCGITLYFSNLNFLSHNMIFSNYHYGISLHSSERNGIIDNYITDNQFGFHFVFSANNSIFHNNIINNDIQAFDCNNSDFWNDSYPSGGNYWSDYNGSDFFSGPNQDIPGSDGIGDTPYYFNYSQDYYPLMYPWGSSLYFSYGWNFVSIPNIQSDSDPETILNSIMDNYSALQHNDASDHINSWKHNLPTKSPVLNRLNEINHNLGFWLEITEPEGVYFKCPGTPPETNQSISLYAGWNMVGYPSYSRSNRTEALNNLGFGNQVDAIWIYDGGGQKWDEIGESDYFVKGKGYWIHATTDCVWELPL